MSDSNKATLMENKVKPMKDKVKPKSTKDKPKPSKDKPKPTKDINNIEDEMSARLIKLVQHDASSPSPYPFDVEDVRELRFMLRKTIASWYDLAIKNEHSRRSYQKAALDASGARKPYHPDFIPWQAVNVIEDVFKVAGWTPMGNTAQNASNKTLSGAFRALKIAVGWMNDALETDGTAHIEFGDEESDEESDQELDEMLEPAAESKPTRISSKTASSAPKALKRKASEALDEDAPLAKQRKEASASTFTEKTVANPGHLEAGSSAREGVFVTDETEPPHKEPKPSKKVVLKLNKRTKGEVTAQSPNQSVETKPDSSKVPNRKSSPWTDRETLELLRVNRQYKEYPKIEDRVRELHRRMEAIREQEGLASQPERKRGDYIGHTTTLKHSNVDLRKMEAKVEKAGEIAVPTTEGEGSRKSTRKVM